MTPEREKKKKKLLKLGMHDYGKTKPPNSPQADKEERNIVTSLPPFISIVLQMSLETDIQTRRN